MDNSNDKKARGIPPDLPKKGYWIEGN